MRSSIETTEEIDRVNDLSSTYNLTVGAGYIYYIGAISQWNNSSLIQI